MPLMDIPITVLDRNALRDAAVELADTQDEIERVLDEIGFPSRSRPDIDGPPDQAWRRIFHEFDDGAIDAPYTKLLTALTRRSADHEVIARLLTTYPTSTVGSTASGPVPGRTSDDRGVSGWEGPYDPMPAPTPAPAGAGPGAGRSARTRLGLDALAAAPAGERSRRRAHWAPAAVIAVALVVIVAAVAVVAVVLSGNTSTASEPGPGGTGTTQPAKDPEERLTTAERQLTATDPNERRAGVRALLGLARDEPGMKQNVCGDLQDFAKGSLRWNAESDRHQGINIADLSVRTPDGYAALNGLSDTGCGSFGPGTIAMERMDLRAWKGLHPNLAGQLITDSHLGNSDLNSANFSAGSLNGDVLQYARMRNANLSGTAMRGCNLEYVRLSDAIMTNADLSPNVDRTTNLSHAQLDGVDLTGANLSGTKMGSVSFTAPTGTTQHTAKLVGANLTGAHLEGADLRFTDLTGAQLSGASADGSTRWPTGFDPRSHGVRVS
ncbi:pentapeptide repeat-containing protein [Pseudofrankia asymbiotica]|uniref:Effector-associated domain-containing protein n=1 Tax=Pseudofrankia asymbiotica TaxID=1834516 RepID=A0A1V2HZV4_9ACTN|nr:pentapeptide repeat-containing protein [Pseudofrankia asymbiotica]ONH22362.1 hypothetical protein BL253_35920 [Pseudofrankia asymbiotica]